MSSYVRFYREPTIEQWATSSLNADELADFRAAYEQNNNQWKQYADAGLITIEPIYSTVPDTVLGESVQVQVGNKVVLAPGTSISDLHMTERYRYWLDLFTESNGPDPVQFVANVA